MKHQQNTRLVAIVHRRIYIRQCETKDIMRHSQLHPCLPLQAPDSSFHFFFIEPTPSITPQGTRQSYSFVLIQMFCVPTPVSLCFPTSAYANLTGIDRDLRWTVRLCLSFEDRQFSLECICLGCTACLRTLEKTLVGCEASKMDLPKIAQGPFELCWVL